MAEDLGDTQEIPVGMRPNPDVGGVFSGEVDSQGEPVATFGEPESEPMPINGGGTDAKGRVDTYVDEEGVERYVNSHRKVRSDRGGPRKAPTGTKARGKGKTLGDPGAAGATILYGGVGAILSVSGLAPAAGLSMQGLADEAGPEIATWAQKRSPRFYGFLVQLSEAGGIGKYIAAPVTAEGYLRLEKARPALGPAVVSMHGQDAIPAFDALTEQYDSWKAGGHGAPESNGTVPPEGMGDPWSPDIPTEETDRPDGR